MTEGSRLTAFFSGALLGAPILLGSLIVATAAPTIAPGLEYLFGTNAASPRYYSLLAIAASIMLSLIPLAAIPSARQKSATYFVALALLALPPIAYLGIGSELAQKAVGIELL